MKEKRRLVTLGAAVSNWIKRLVTQIGWKISPIVRMISSFAWEDMFFDVSRVEWKYGRNDDGSAKNWKDWNNVRDHLRNYGKLRKPEELNDQHNAEVWHAGKMPPNRGDADGVVQNRFVR